MIDQLAYSQKQFTRAVNLSALLGWACIAIPMAVGGSVGIFIWAAIIGLPISFLCCWLIGAPILKRVMSKEVSWLGAAFWGGAIAFLIAMASTVIGRFRGWRQSLNPNVNSQLGGGEHIREVDGIMTAYGWLMLGQTTAMFVAIGMIVAMLVRFCIGKPTTSSGKF